VAKSGRPQDAYGKRAKKAGYPSRAIYKLEEIDRRLSLLKPGLRVLDLGAAPGSWTRYVAERVGPSGRVVAIDLKPIEIALPGHATAILGDALAVETAQLEGPFDVVLSDMAPATSGQRHRDQYLSYELYSRALEVAVELLVPGGTFVGKIFQGAEFPDARKATAQHFERVRIFKPEASRKESYEVFLAGLRKREASSS
jgi:23S rRNA (uridine2552-2'-O)-methyltransferase